MGKKIAIKRIIEPINVLSSMETSSHFAKSLPNQSFPFLRIRIGKMRLNPKLINMFSRLGGEYGVVLSDIGRIVKHQHKIKSPLIVE